MSRRMRIARNIAMGLAAAVIVAGIALIMVVRTAGFRDYVRRKVITATEDGTGGRVEIGSFAFDWTHLRAVFTDFVIHGNEPPPQAPYLSAKRVEIHLRLFTNLHHLLDVAYLGLDHPEANVLIYPDGSTNLPKPKEPSHSTATPLETVVDLAVGHMELSNGSFTVNSRKQPFDLRCDQLRLQLWYDILKRGYKGQIALSPLYAAGGRNTPVKFNILLPVTLERDKISFRGGRIATSASQVAIDGSIEDLRNPKTTAHIGGYVALSDLKNVGDVQLTTRKNGIPSTVNLDVNAVASDNMIRVYGARLSLGESNIEASGTLQDPSGNGQLEFHSRLALGELGRLIDSSMRPDGVAQLNGTAKIDAQRNYDLKGNLEARGLSFNNGSHRIRNVNMASAVRMTPRQLALEGFRLQALGAEMIGNATLEDFARYNVEANLHRLDLLTLQRELGQKNPAYDGNAAGPISASGDLHAAGTRSLMATARVTISPGRRGIPVSGKLFANYRGDQDNVTLSDSYIALPHSRLTVSGSLGNRLAVALNTTDFRDLSPLIGGEPALGLQGGQAGFTGAVTGRLNAPQITGHLAMDHFTVQGRQFDTLAADVAASNSRAAVSNARLARGPMLAQFNAGVGLVDWDATPNQPLTVQASIGNGDLADLLSIAGVAPAGYSGELNASVNVSGTVGNPHGAASLNASNGTVHSEPFDSIQVQVNLADQLATVPSAQITSGASHVNLTAEFHHPRDHFDRGQIHAHLQSNQVDLARVRAVQNERPNASGTLQLNADMTAELRDSKPRGKTEFALTDVTGDASGRSLQMEGQNYGDFTATARTSGQNVTYNVTSDFAGSQIRVNGATQLTAGYPTTADAAISGLPVDRTLQALKRTDIAARGTLTANAHVAGTIDHPEGTLDATVDRAVFDGEPIDRARVRATYLASRIDVPQLEIHEGQSVLSASARYDHPAGNLNSGELEFHVNPSRVDLAHIQHVQKTRPGIAGLVQLTASGNATVQSANPRVLAHGVNLDFNARGIAAQGKNLGDLTLAARTAGGRVNFSLESTLANASIQGRGTAELNGNYPLDAQLTFRNVTWGGLQPLLGPPAAGTQDFDGIAEGDLDVSGPLVLTNELRGRLRLSKAQLTAPLSSGNPRRAVLLENQGPVELAMDRGTVRIESLHLSGPQTDVQAQGSVALQAQTLQASVNAHADLALLRRFSRDVTSSGEVTAAATLRGTFAQPMVNGKIQLHDASINVVSLPSGLSNANGEIDFNGSTATMSNLTGEVGGGKVTLAGFMNYSQPMRFGLRASASSVRVRLQPGVSVAADADLRVTGRTEASVVSGNVTIVRMTYAPESDFGSILSRAAPPVQSSTAPAPILDNMKLDVAVRTSSATRVQASMAQNIQLDADLHVQGTASRPGMLGRVSLNEGKLVFFSSSYQVNTGTIAFYNPLRIEPILDLNLQTQAKGVDVTLRVTGPVDNMKLTYTSEPPLQFQEIVGLLAAGRVPTSDPTLLANQPAQPPQTFEQMGESTVLSKALADPIANRLQRVFGVTQLKVDPTFTSGSDLPQAQLTLQQQVTSQLTLTYVTALDNPSTAVLRGEWAINPQWSATAMRDQYGIVSVRLHYKKQFR